MKKKVKVFLIILVLIIILGISAYFAYTKLIPVKNENLNESKIEEEVNIKKPEVKIFSGKDRPVAVMIDNNKNAWPQASINKAFIVYEIIVEGGETRLMALFKGASCDSIGPIRSSRHYFLDYALENDAIYAHLGWSPQAQSDISNLKVDNINGQNYDSGTAKKTGALFWRNSNKSKPHNAYTNTESLLSISKKLNYRTTSTKSSVLNYVTDEINFDDNELAINANKVTIPYTSSNKVQYVYNQETGRYEKYSKGKKQEDETTGEVFSAKNIILTMAENYTLNDGENKGRQGLNNIGSLNGYYITNGKAIKIICKKDNRTSKTEYIDVDGNSIQINDGNTFINICPKDSNIIIE